jgi:hypothetical protein
MKLFHWIAAGLLAIGLTPAAAQQRIDRPGPVAHPTAGTVFPERVGEFQRENVTQYDQAGADVSATYELARGNDRLRLSVYIYPAPAVEAGPGSAQSADVARATLCRTELGVVGQVIENQPQYRGARRVEEGAAPAVEGVEPALSLRTVHSFTAAFFGPEQEMRSETDLYCYVGGRWLVKYRASSNAGFDASEAVEAFIRAGPWPGRNPPPEADKVVMRPGAAASPS